MPYSFSRTKFNILTGGLTIVLALFYVSAIFLHYELVSDTVQEAPAPAIFTLDESFREAADIKDGGDVIDRCCCLVLLAAPAKATALYQDKDGRQSDCASSEVEFSAPKFALKTRDPPISAI